jgi:hypothetical protein
VRFLADGAVGLIAPVLKRLTMLSTDSTSSIGIGFGKFEIQQAAQGAKILRLVVHQPRIP